MSIGTRIKEARINRGYTQLELARYIGVSKGAIGNYENEVSSPRNNILQKIMAALDVDANYIYQDYCEPMAQKGLRFLDAECALVLAYRKANADDRAIIDNIVARYTHAADARCS